MIATSAEWDSREAKPSAWQHSMQYLVATIIVFTVGMIAVIVVSILKAGEDNGILITAIIGFTGTTLGSVLAFMKSQETHTAVNSRMDDFIKKFEQGSVAKQDLARNEGRSAGRAEGRDIADARTDILSGHSAKLSPRTKDIELRAEKIEDPLLAIEKNTKEAAEALKEIKDRE